MSDVGKDGPPAERPPRVLTVALVGAALLWLAQPPAALWPLAYAGAACWLWLAGHDAPFGRREYLRVWLGGVAYWLLAVHWVRLPHPLTPLGWAPLAMYLALYPLLTVAATRHARRVWAAPLWLAGPIAWTGAELLQARLFTGFLMGAVSHSHAGQGWVRSIAAYAGAYGVTFAVVLVAATLARAFRTRKPGYRALGGTVVAALAVVLTGWAARDSIAIDTPDGPRPRVALIQGDTRAVWDADPSRSKRIMDRQEALSVRAYEEAEAAGERLDLIVWPESMFRSWLFTFGGSYDLPPDAPQRASDVVTITRSLLRSITSQTGGTPLLVGIDHFDWPDAVADPEGYASYNSLLLAGPDGDVLAVYDKTHLVPFGEYIPLAGGVPALYYLTPMAGGLATGDGPVAMDVPLADGGVLRLCPSICYESVVPRVIRRHVAELTRRGARPDALVNATNDAWFWGASELDMHLTCGVFRAVENGLPLLVAANGGLSAIVDARGDLLRVSPRMTEHVLAGEVPPRTAAPTPYSRWGDWPAGVCLAATLACLADAVRRRAPWRRFSGDAG